MAISIKEIKEKQFSIQSNGYNCDEVDDFLDALAAQMSELVQECRTLKDKLNNAPAPVAAVSDGEAYDEPSYFKNLEQAMRETLISSQRIADETIADARKKAGEIVNAAQEKADEMTGAAQAEVEAAKSEVEGLKAQVGAYREQALQTLDLQQLAIEEMRNALKEN